MKVLEIQKRDNSSIFKIKVDGVIRTIGIRKDFIDLNDEDFNYILEQLGQRK